MLFKSYNQTHGTDYEYQAGSEVGYQIRKASTDSWQTRIYSIINTSDSLYVCEELNTKASALWLASPSNAYIGYLFNVSYNGGVGDCNLYSSENACRPVVCLRSDVKLQASGECYILK